MQDAKDAKAWTDANPYEAIVAEKIARRHEKERM